MPLPPQMLVQCIAACIVTSEVSIVHLITIYVPQYVTLFHVHATDSIISVILIEMLLTRLLM